MHYSRCSKIPNTIVFCKKYIKQQNQSDLGLSLFYSHKHYISSSLDNRDFILEQKEKSVRNF